MLCVDEKETALFADQAMFSLRDGQLSMRNDSIAAALENIRSKFALRIDHAREGCALHRHRRSPHSRTRLRVRPRQ